MRKDILIVPILSGILGVFVQWFQLRAYPIPNSFYLLTFITYVGVVFSAHVIVNGFK